MAKRNRMLRILTALAGSMIGGALLLAGSQPGAVHSSGRPAVLLHARGTQEPIAGAENPASWRKIRVLIDGDQDRNLLSGNVLSEVPTSHFLIQPDGLLSLQPAWHERTNLTGDEPAIVVRVESNSDAQQPLRVQLETLHLLLRHLESQFGLSRHDVEYR